MIAGQFALVLHYADDEDHAWRIWDTVFTRMPVTGDARVMVEIIKQVAIETRIPVDRAPIV